MAIKRKKTDRTEEFVRAGGEDVHLFPPRQLALETLEAAGGAEAEGAYSAILETICGATDDSQPVEQYNGGLGVTVAFVNANQGPVGQLQWNNDLATIYTNPGDVSGARWATGTLLANNLFLTAGHNFDQTGGGWTRPRVNGTFNTISPQEIATRMHVNFNYQVDPSGTLRTEQQFPVLQLVEYRLGGLDFAIARLGGNPAATFGTARISSTNAAVGESICIMGHPMGVPKRIEAGVVLSVGGNEIRYNDIDTLGGNSGSGILRASDGRVVGVHTNGGCNAAGTGSNRGFPIAAIIAASPTLQGLLPTSAIADATATTIAADVATTVSLDRPATSATADRTFVDADVVGTTTVVTDRTTVFRDRGFTTLKSIDDRKLPGLDKRFGDVKLAGRDIRDFDPFGGDPFARPGREARPFILANPHHAVLGGEEAAANEELQMQYESAIVDLQQQLQQGQAELAVLEARYAQLVEEYQATFSQ